MYDHLAVLEVAEPVEVWMVCPSTLRVVSLSLGEPLISRNSWSEFNRILLN